METLTLHPTELDAGKRVDAWLPSQAEGLTRSAALLQEALGGEIGRAHV